jgi:hypothetical protein
MPSKDTSDSGRRRQGTGTHARAGNGGFDREAVDKKQPRREGCIAGMKKLNLPAGMRPVAFVQQGKPLDG